MDLSKYIANVPDYPKTGIEFKDITPLLANGKAYAYAINQLTEFAKEKGTEVIVGPEARGFIFGCPMAKELKIGFVPVRKPSKLPREVQSIKYELEYGTNTISIHRDGIKPGQRVLIVDDILATGGTIKATKWLVENLGGVVVGCAFLINLSFLNGHKQLGSTPYITLIKY